MKFGLSMFGYGPRHYAKVAAEAEANGFESVWLSEHLVFPAVMPQSYPYSDTGYPGITTDIALFDPWIVLAAVAQATERIRLATCVYILPLRHPLITARSVVTLDRLSNGRVVLGVGVGWLEEEFTLLGLDPKTRGQRADETIEILRRLWTEDVIEHRGPEFQFGPLKFQPKPRNGTIPIEIGGTTRRALRRAGTLGNGWIETGSKTKEEFAERLGFLNAMRREAGREQLPFEVTMIPGKHDWANTPEGVRQLEALGVTRLILSPLRESKDKGPVELPMEWIARYANEVIDKLR